MKMTRILNKKIKNRYLIYFILSGLIIGSFFGALLHDSVLAETYEGYYIEKFTRADTETNFTLSDGGNDWGYVNNVIRSSVNGYTYQVNSTAGTSYPGIANIYIYEETIGFKFNTSLYTVSGGYRYIYFAVILYSHDLQVVNILGESYAGPGSSHSYFYILDSANASLKALVDSGSSSTVWVNFTFSNQSIFIHTSLAGDVWYEGCPNFGYVDRVCLYAFNGIPGYPNSCYGQIDDFGILTTSYSGELYDIDCDKESGNVLYPSSSCGFSDLSVPSGSPASLPMMEEKFDGDVFYYQLEQLAIAVGDISTVPTRSINLYLDGLNQGSYDAYYYYDNRFVLVYQNLNYNFTSELVMEFILVGIAGDDLEVMTATYDVNSDGYLGCRYGYGIGSFGVYDGGTLYGSKEILHKLWLNYTQETGDFQLPYESICNIPDYDFTYYSATEPYFEFQTDVKMTAYINALDLYVYFGQIWDISDNINDYRLYVNGEGEFKADEIIPYTEILYIIRFEDLNVLVTDNTVKFELFCPECTGFIWCNHWLIPRAEPSYFISKFYFHNNPFFYGDGAIEGDVQQLYSAPVCVWYTDYITNPSYNNTIYVVPDKEYYLEYESITITGTVGDFIKDNNIKLYHDGVQVTKHGFQGDGYLIEYPNYNFFAPFVFDSVTDDGTWNICLQYDHVNVSWFNLTVINRDDYNSVLWTFPNPSKNSQVFEIGWLYNDLYYNDTGIILISDSVEFNKYSTIVTSGITDNGTTNYILYEDGIYFLFLCKENDGDYLPIETYKHIVGENWFNEIYVSYPELMLSNLYSETLQAQQHIYGRHSYTYGDVYIKDNGVKIRSVSGEPIFDFYQTYYDTGLHNLTLCVYLGETEGEIVLDSVSFAVKPYKGIDEEFGLAIEPPFSYFAGIFLIIIFTLSPLIILVGVGKSMNREFNLNSIPQYLYLICAVVGFIITIVIGWFPMWSIFVLIVLFVLIFAIMWLRGKTEKAGD